MLRVLIGRAAARGRRADRVVVIECEIDDMNPQIFGVVMDRLYAAGALEVFYIPVQMKKNRPGTLLTRHRAAGASRGAGGHHLSRDDDDRRAVHRGRSRDACSARSSPSRRRSARCGSRSPGATEHVVNAVPEFDDCVAIAARAQLPVKEVQAIAVAGIRRCASLAVDRASG